MTQHFGTSSHPTPSGTPLRFVLAPIAAEATCRWLVLLTSAFNTRARFDAFARSQPQPQTAVLCMCTSLLREAAPQTAHWQSPSFHHSQRTRAARQACLHKHQKNPRAAASDNTIPSIILSHSELFSGAWLTLTRKFTNAKIAAGLQR